MSRSRMPKDLRWDTQVAFMVNTELGDRINEYVVRHRHRSLGAALRELVTNALDADKNIGLETAIRISKLDKQSLAALKKRCPDASED